MKRSYQKPPLSFADQGKQLVDRGLHVRDVVAAEAYLAGMNYYRFSGYCLPFEVARHQFAENVRFEDIQELAEYDRRLRSLVLEGLGYLEVGLKTHVAYQFAHLEGNPFPQLNKEHFCPSFAGVSGARGFMRRLADRVRPL